MKRVSFFLSLTIQLMVLAQRQNLQDFFNRLQYVNPASQNTGALISEACLTNTENTFFGTVYSFRFMQQAQNRMVQIERSLEAMQRRTNKIQTDTLFISDSIHVTGNFSWTGTIVVYGHGKLILNNAQATIYGDLVAFGSDARIIIQHSDLNMPQFYLYQRAILSVSGAMVHVENSTWRTSQMPHNLIVAQNSSAIFQNVQKDAITTCGLSATAYVQWHHTNLVEFILTENATLDVYGGNTLLFWHHVKQGQSLHFTFPDGQNIVAFEFNSSLPGISNISYQYQIANAQNCMWALMPEEGCDVVITNSTLRTIGLFAYTTQNLSGFTNNSLYTNFLAPFPDRILHLVNTYVLTWSLYAMGSADIALQSCILGEIGLFDNAYTSVHNSVIDGSGGYVFTEQNSLILLAYSSLFCDFHTNDQSFGIMAYSNQQFGRAIAKNKSIMAIIQSNLLSMPELYDDAMIWYGKLEGNTLMPMSTQTVIYGSAWIEKGSNYYPHDLAWYKVEYTQDGNNWIQICKKFGEEKFSDTLCIWDNASLSAGQYFLKLTICDNTPDSNQLEAVRQYYLQPGLGIEAQQGVKVSIYPVPTIEVICLSGLKNYYSSYQIVDIQGRVVADGQLDSLQEEHCIDVSMLPAGTYICMFHDKNVQFLPVRFVKVR